MALVVVTPWDWVPHGQIPHLIVGNSPRSVGVESHQMTECNVVVVYIIPNIG